MTAELEIERRTGTGHRGDFTVSWLIGGERWTFPVEYSADNVFIEAFASGPGTREDEEVSADVADDDLPESLWNALPGQIWEAVEREQAEWW